MAPSDRPATVGEALALGRQLSTGESPPLTPTTAQALLAFVTGRGRAWLLAHREAPLPAADARRFVGLLERAAAGEPLAHLTGEREFYGLPFTVTPDVLVPRPETEALVDVALAWARDHSVAAPRIVDVGTGSGAIAVTLAVRLPGARVTAVELSEPAIRIAQGNVERHGVAERVALVLGDLLRPLAGPFDIIVANLPYINQQEIEALDVGRWEPRIALDGGPDGLDLVRALLEQAPSRLAPGGLVALEIGYDQGPRAVALCRAAFPGAGVALLPDLAGLDRIVKVETHA